MSIILVTKDGSQKQACNEFMVYIKQPHGKVLKSDVVFMWVL
jgi:hypothetical protein